MAPITQRLHRTGATIEHDEHGDHAHVETIEHETVEFDGCSEAEVKAKLQDFDAWAS